MDFALSEEQQMLADTVGRYVEKEYPFEARRKLAATPLGYSADHWAAFAELGLLGVNVPAEQGGMGYGAAESLIVMEAFGSGLVLEPYVSTAVVGAWLIGAHGSAAQKDAILPRIVEGKQKLALAALEPGARFDLWDVSTTATADGGQYKLNGRKAVVLHGDSADTLIVSARTAGAQTEQDGITLFLVDAHAPGVEVRGFPTIDGQRAAEVMLTNVAVQADAIVGGAAQAGRGYAALEAAVDRGLAALCAEAVGAMAKLMEVTAEYLRTRKQFGKPIGSFQALQHRAADMLAAIEKARSMALYAVAKIDEPDARERRRAISAAKAVIGRSGRYVGQQAIQLHGGMGMTDELPVGYYFKRLTCIDMTWGDTAHHTELFGASA